ncbi:hypothetical protein EJ07DRAFT_156712 [Lizonia empirigonia]|nr:hypothetical protein EJ07DRAFT_156712 [Lizonia empirigonia]
MASIDAVPTLGLISPSIVLADKLQTPPRAAHVIAQSHQPHTADHTPHTADHTPHNLTTPDATPPNAIPRDTIPHHTNLHRATPHNTHNNTEPHIHADGHFRTAFPSYKEYRIERLVRVAEEFAQSKKFVITTEIRAPKVPARDPMAQATMMFWTVKQSSARKYRLYFADAVEQCTASVKAAGPTMKKTVAYNYISKLLNVDRQQVVSMDNEGNKYLTCMEMGGAALYSADITKTDIISLNEEDIQALCIYRRIKTAKVQAEIRKADVDVARFLRDELLALGLKNTDIERRDTRLTRLICEPHGKESALFKRDTVPADSEGIQPNASTQQSNQGISQKRANIDEQPRRSDSSQPSAVPESAKNFILTKKRKTNTHDPTSSSRSSIPKPRHHGSTTQAEGQHFSASIPSHMEQRADITPCSREGYNMQHGDIMDLDARMLCQDNVVDACETPHEADIRKRQRTENGAEHSQTPVIIVDNVDTDNHDSPALQPSGLDQPQHSRSPSAEAIDCSAGLISGSREESILIESTRHSSPPDGQVINNESIAAITTSTENAESSAISIDTSFTAEDQQRQYSENARSVERSSHSDLHTAFKGEHQNDPTSYPEDIEQTRRSRSRSVDESLPSYGLSNLLPEPCDELSYCFLQSSSPQITS